ncbi:MAG TPA: YceI family protein [Blastocatellia bacterium]|nr:YceI family protein [Blastocatellia bacterium]
MNKLIKRSIFFVSIALLLAFAQFKANQTGLINSEAFASEFAARSADNKTPQATGAGTYAIDPAHTTIGFSVRHLVINNVPGRFREFNGTIQFDPENLTNSSVTFTAKSNSIDTGIEPRDKHLRSADFFDVERYPEITFKSTRIEKKGKDDFIAHGDFTLHGVTRPVALPFKLYGAIKDPWGKMRIGVEAGLTINRQDYGVAWSQKLGDGGLVVANDVKIALFVEAVKQEMKPEAPSNK